MTQAQEMQLKLPAQAESVAVVRHALSGIADTITVEPNKLSDMKTAVTEACNNVVVHAYLDTDGTLEVNARPRADRLTVTVRDYGHGMQPRSVTPDEPSLGLGLPLIAALSDRFEIRGGTGLGISVTMTFGLNEGTPEFPDEDEDESSVLEDSSDEPPNAHPKEPPKAAEPDTSKRSAGISITPGPLVGPVLARVTAILAARADFSLDRLSDAVLVSDAVSAHAASFVSGDHVDVAIEDGEGTLDIRVGPLVNGGAGELLGTMKVPGLERSLENLTDEVKIEKPDNEPAADEEYLLLTISRT
jgi:serine/threonine-protein kinase RsbW